MIPTSLNPSCDDEWDHIQQSIIYYINRLQSITTLREGIHLLYDLICFIISQVVKYCCRTSSSCSSSNSIHNNTGASLDNRFRDQNKSDLVFNHIATTYTAMYFYIIVALSMFTHQLWILHGISIYIAGTIASYVIKWIMYILDDPELIHNYKYIRGWAQLLIHEGEDIINGDAAWKLASAYLMVQQAPTGMSYLRYIVRYKTRLLRKQFLMELGGNRFGGGLRISALTSKLAASIIRANSTDTDTDINKNQMFDDDGDGYYEEIWHNDKNDVELVLQQRKKRW